MEALDKALYAPTNQPEISKNCMKGVEKDLYAQVLLRLVRANLHHCRQSDQKVQKPHLVVAHNKNAGSQLLAVRNAPQ